MESIRAAYRLILFFLFSLLILVLFCLALPFCIFRESDRIRCKNWLISRWSKGVALILGMSTIIKGTPPKPPFFLVSNHLGYVDILPLWSCLKTTFIAKSEIEKWPFFGVASRLLGIIFIDRTNRKDIHRVNKLIEDNILGKQGVILFPEGTSSKGEEVLPFKSSLLHYPASNNMPVNYASISYEIDGRSVHRAWNDICWWGDMDFLSHFWRLLKIKSWTATVCFGDETVINENRKILSRTLHQNITAIFVPTFK